MFSGGDQISWPEFDDSLSNYVAMADKTLRLKTGTIKQRSTQQASLKKY
jgi:hypothetical protein